MNKNRDIWLLLGGAVVSALLVRYTVKKGLDVLFKSCLPLKSSFGK